MSAATRAKVNVKAWLRRANDPGPRWLIAAVAGGLLVGVVWLLVRSLAAPEITAEEIAEMTRNSPCFRQKALDGDVMRSIERGDIHILMTACRRVDEAERAEYR